VKNGSAGIGTQVTMVAPVARPIKAPARRRASASTPVSAMVTRVFMRLSSASGDSKVCLQVSLQK